MHGAMEFLDGPTVLMGIGLASMLSRRWITWEAIAVAVGVATFSYAQYAQYWHPRWLGGVPQVLVAFAAFGLAFLGGHVALSPPREDQKVLRRVYLVSFALLACLGTAADLWQRSIEEEKQEILRRSNSSFRLIIGSGSHI